MFLHFYLYYQYYPYIRELRMKEMRSGPNIKEKGMTKKKINEKRN